MSHITTMKTEFVVIDYLLESLKDIDAHILSTASNLVIASIPTLGRQVTFRKSATTFQIEADWWGTSTTDQERFLGKLKQRYVYRAACATYGKQGYQVISEEEESTGRINLVLRKITG